MRRVLFTIIIFIFTTISSALTLPDKPQTRVVDIANMFSKQQEQDLETKLQKVYKRNQGTEIEILTINSLESQNIEDIALDTARKWKLGRKGINNGLLILIAKEDKAVRIEIGYGLEAAIPDGVAGEIERQVLIPSLESANLYSGINITLDKLIIPISKEYPASITNSIKGQYPLYYYIVGFSILIILLILVISGNWRIALDILQLILGIINSGNKDSKKDIGNGGDFGGGGTSGKF